MVKKESEHIVLKKWQLRLGMIAAILIPVGSAIGAYYSKVSSVEAMIHAVDKKITMVSGSMSEELSKEKLYNSNTYVRQKDMKDLRTKLEKVAEDVGWIRGYLKKEHRSN